MFFFPLIVIQVPIVGEQSVSGYDIFSKMRQFSNDVDKSSETSQTSSREQDPGANRRPSSSPTTLSSNQPALPLSLRVAWLIPINITASFILAAVTFVGARSRVPVSCFSAIAGAVLSVFALAHVTIVNSDLHTWLASSFKASSEELKGNPFAGLAEQFGNLMLNSFKLRAGAGLYVLGTALLVAAVLAKTRALNRFRVVSVAQSASAGR